MIGKIFGKWTVLRQLPSPKGNLRGKLYLCLCECGNKSVIPGITLRADRSHQCQDCMYVGLTKGEIQRRPTQKRKKRAAHGQSGTKAYYIWALMKQRCDNPKRLYYPRYGGRGIKVCERWREFTNFLEDMGHPQDGMQLDRIDNNGNYEPSNCKWSTPKENSTNKGY
jgi:hypothetical protein